MVCHQRNNKELINYKRFFQLFLFDNKNTRRIFLYRHWTKTNYKNYYAWFFIPYKLSR
jgi:hypothetical protein